MALGAIRRTIIAAVATVILAPTSAYLLAAEAAATTGGDIVNLANDNIGKGACSTNSLGGQGYFTSCVQNWCADFAMWVWANSGVNITGLSAEAGSFYTYGTKNGTMHAAPQLGDAVVFDYHGAGNADHVGLVSAVYSDGQIQVINGNFGSSPSTSKVKYSSGHGVVGASIAGQTIAAFVGGIGVTGSTTPQIRPDLVNQVNGDGYADLVGVDANGELFGYNNGALINADHVPFASETWRIAGSDWTGAKDIATADVSGDGFADLLGTMSDGSLSIYANGSKVNDDGMPYAAETWHSPGSWQNMKQFAAGDVTGDGYADIVAVDATGALVVYANGLKVNGTPYTAETYHIGGNWSAVRQLALTDINHDGYADIVAVDANGELFGYNNGALVNANHVPFASETWRITGSDWSGVTQFTAGEFSGDGYGDLMAVEADGSLSVYANNILNTPTTPYAARTWHIGGDWSTVKTLA
jgi:hypothetical protein